MNNTHLPLLIALLLVPLSGTHAADDFVITHRATIFRHIGEDPKDPQNTSGFNHGPSVVLLPDGRLMAAWFSAPLEGAPSQRILRAFSQDRGHTWTKAETLQDFPGRADFDPSFVVSGPSTFLFFSASQPSRVYFRRSDDSGATWGVPVELGQPGHSTRSNGIRLATGELLVPLHRTGTRAGGVMKSTDDGRTWTRFGQVANPNGQGGEPTVAQLRSGRVLMILRTKDKQVWRAHSDDRGQKWSTPEIIPRLSGVTSASHLLCLRNGRLILTRNPGPDPYRFPLVMHVSDDEGKTWSEPFLLADRPEKFPGWQTSYPSVIELPDGTLLAAWTQIRGTRSVLYGDICCARLSSAPTPSAAGEPIAPLEGRRRDSARREDGNFSKDRQTTRRSGDETHLPPD